MIRFRLKEILQDRKMSITELHERTGISQNTISLITNGKSNGIQLSTMEKILEATGAKIEELFEYIGEPFKISVVNHSNEKYRDKQNFKLGYRINASDKDDNVYTIDIELDFIYYSLANRKTIHLSYLNKSISPINTFTENFYSGSSAIISSIVFLIIHDLIANNRVDFVSTNTLIMFDWNGFVPLSHKYCFIRNFLETDESSSLLLFPVKTVLENPQVGNIITTDSSAYVEVYLA